VGVRGFSVGGLALQPKLAVGRADDDLEREADRVADRVMRAPDPGAQAAEPRAAPASARLQRACAACEAEDAEAGEGLLQREADGAEAGGRAAPPIVHETLGSAGEPLDPVARAFMEPRFGRDFSGVRVHTDARASASARAVDALAYTVGEHVVFGAGRYAPATPEGQRLLAHELAHTVQQGALGAPAVVARQDRRVLDALTRRDEIAGVGNPQEALTILRTLDADEMVATLILVDDNYQLDVLVSAIGTSDTSAVGSAIYAVRFTSPNGTPDDQFGRQAARGLAQLPQDQQDAILSRVLARRGGGVTLAQVREGIAALSESESALDAEGVEEVDDPSALSVMPLLAGVAMGPWNPGGMPIPFYIGNSAHIAIAARYASQHTGDAAFYNFSPISAIVEAARALGRTVNPAALTAAQLGLKPDIANLTRVHLYEIKPTRLQTLGAAEALLYQAAFVLAGIPMLLGPIGEPGTSGTVPAPGGWFTFSSPEPGVITYGYRQPRRRRVRAQQPSTSTQMSRSLVDEIAAATGLSGAALIIYIILSEGSRVVIPVRNLVPVP